ncbi:p6-pol [Orbilia brochopaga]|nr:p6-pol [Drechslerella brochopaga]
METGHSAGSCPTPKCSICNTDGHIAFNCPDKSCLFCGEKGHIAKECEKKALEPCRNCQESGHKASECKNPRKMHTGEEAAAVGEKEIEDAWAAMKKAGDEKDLDEFKDAFEHYLKIQPESRFPELQSAFKENNFGYNLVAVKKEITSSQTIIDLQGNMEKEFVVTFQTSLKGRRSRFASSNAGRFPENDAENLKRLENAGFVKESFIPWCMNCKERGHGSRNCPQEVLPRESEAPTVKCVNCGEEGHRARDCTEERKKPINRNACRNCGEEGHEAKECEKPRDASNVQCRKCEKTGHFSKDCPDAPKLICRNCEQEGHRAADCTEPRKVTCNNCGEEGHMRADCTAPRNPATMKCRNCDEMGHGSRDCPKPRDITRVKCNECGEMGHYGRNCQNKGAGGDAGGDAGGADDFASANAASGGADYTKPIGGWDAQPIETSVGGW